MNGTDERMVSKRQVTGSRRVARWLLWVVPVAVLVNGAPAMAHHDVDILHVRPVMAAQGVQLDLAVFVDSDSGAGERVTLTTYYETEAGAKALSREFQSGGKTVIVTVPGSDVDAPAFRYWFVATQRGSRSDVATSRAPAEGAYQIPVTAVGDPIDFDEIQRWLEVAANAIQDLPDLGDLGGSIERARKLVEAFGPVIQQGLEALRPMIEAGLQAVREFDLTDLRQLVDEARDAIEAFRPLIQATIDLVSDVGDQPVGDELRDLAVFAESLIEYLPPPPR